MLIMVLGDTSVGGVICESVVDASYLGLSSVTFLVAVISSMAKLEACVMSQHG